MKRSLYLAVIGLTLSVGTAFAEQPPIGFERWEKPPSGPFGEAASGVEFGLKPSDIYKKYAAQLLIGLPGTGPHHEQKDRRLIDIEIRSDGTGVGNYVYDIVWVRNEGDFELDSWFLHGLTADEVKLLEEFDDVIILDIERLPHEQEWRYSIILERNSGKFDWKVLLGVDLSTASQALHGDWRVVDVDRYQACSRRRPHPRRQACPPELDVVMVENTGTNFVNSFDLFEALPPVEVGGFQLVDLEAGEDFVSHLTNWISPGSEFVTNLSFTADEVIFGHNHRGRVIDLEIVEEFIDPSNHALGSTFKWWTVNLTDQ